MDRPSQNCREGEHGKCWGCACPDGCHAVPPPDSFRAAREELARRREARRGGEEE